MAIFYDLIDMEEEYRKVKDEAIILNDLDMTLESDRETFNRIIYTVTDDKPISMVPTCKCGHTAGAILINKVRCSKCGEFVQDFATQIQSKVWIRRPVNGPGFMLPYVYIVLSELKLKNIKLLEFMLDPNYDRAIRREQTVYWNILNDVLSPEQRNYNYFYHNFIRVMHEIMERLNRLRPGLSGQEDFRMFYQKYIVERGHLLFTNYLPVVSNMLLTKEKSSKGIYIMAETPDLVNALLEVINIPPSASTYEASKRVMASMEGARRFFERFIRSMVDTKGGISRKNRNGTRMPFSFRCVVSSISGPHDARELHIPWTIGLELYRPMIISKLKRKGYSIRQIDDTFRNAFYNYSTEIDNIFQEIISESKHIGPPVLVNRNPSIWAGSIFLLYNTKVKTDLTDTTMSISIQIVAPPNCDFDGDELNAYLLPDEYTYQLLRPFEPHNVVPDDTAPKEVHPSFTIPKPVCGSINSFLLDYV